MKIAQYIIPGCGENPYVREVDVGVIMDYVRVSEIVEVEFKELDLSETLPAEIAALDKKEQRLKEELAARLADINNARDKLKAIPLVSAR